MIKKEKLDSIGLLGRNILFFYSNNLNKHIGFSVVIQL
jgi:hypothetical protein